MKMPNLGQIFSKKPPITTPDDLEQTDVKKDVPAQILTNRRGNEIPIDQIKPHQAKEHHLTNDLLAEGRALSQALANFRQKCLFAIPQHREHISETYGVKLRPNKKGNMTISTFDGKGKIELRVTEFLTFGSELSAAKEIIDECINRWCEGADDKIKTLIDDAFQTDAKNRINVQRVLGLRQYEFDDENWKTAMTMISDAVRVAHSKSYITLSEFDENEDRLVTIPLSLSSAS